MTETSPPFLAPLRFQKGDLIFRIYGLEDDRALRAAVNESYAHLAPWMPWAQPEQTELESHVICRRLISGYLTGTDYTLGIWRDQDLMGGTGFHLRCGLLEWKCAEIGMWIRASESGKGMGTTALKAMLEWGFGEWGWERLIWKCDTRNIASRRVAEHAGMTLESTFRSDALDTKGNRRDTHQFAILKSEWQTL